jgi:hypothetical protein
MKMNGDLMKKALLVIFLWTVVLLPQYIKGDFVRDISFTDSDVDSAMGIIYTQKSIKELISSGRLVVLSFFSPG